MITPRPLCVTMRCHKSPMAFTFPWIVSLQVCFGFLAWVPPNLLSLVLVYLNGLTFEVNVLKVSLYRLAIQPRKITFSTELDGGCSNAILNVFFLVAKYYKRLCFFFVEKKNVSELWWYTTCTNLKRAWNIAKWLSNVL